MNITSLQILLNESKNMLFYHIKICVKGLQKFYGKNGINVSVYCGTKKKKKENSCIAFSIVIFHELSEDPTYKEN